MPKGKFKAEYTGKKENVPGIVTFSFMPPEKIGFRAGQFAFFEFESGGKNFSKHFTVSSQPESRQIEFTTIMSGSDYKQALNKLPLGTIAEISPPMGSFTLDARKSDKIAFLAGGIGITPVKSILESMATSKKPKGLEIAVFYSNRNRERIAFRERLEQLAQKIGNVQIINTLTELSESLLEKGLRKKASQGEKAEWKGETGFISSEMVKRHLKNWQEYCYYVAGPPAFNEAMKKMLLEELRIKPEMIVFETFSGY